MDKTITSTILDDIDKKNREYASQGIKTAAGLLDVRPKIKEWMEKLAENTVVHMEDEWMGHIDQNWPYLEKNKKFGSLIGSGRDKTSIIVGASPALKKNVDDLKKIEGEFRDRFVLFVVNSAAEYVLSKGVKPDYIISVDADEEVWTRDLSKVNGCGVPLLCSPFVWPEVPKNWKGELIFIPMGCKDEKVQNDVLNVLNAPRTIPGCGNAFNEAVFISFWCLDSRNFVLVGNELSWPIGGKYYVDGKHSNDEEDDTLQKVHTVDIYGKQVVTTAGHWVFKIWLEDMASKVHGVFINATEAGILGVSPEDGLLPFIKQFYLGKAIKYIKGLYRDAKDWHFMEAMKYSLAWARGYDCKGVPNPSMIKSLKPKTILDVGCGSGATVEELTKMGFEAYGIDMATIVSNRWNGVGDKCYLAFADNIPSDDNYFDLAISDILEHQPVDAVGATIQEIARVSKRQMFNVEYGDAQWLIDGRIDPHTIKKPREWWIKEFKRNGLEIVAKSGNRTFVTKKKEN